MNANARGPLPPRSPAAVPVVGLGGSAGALASFEAFFKRMPADTGAAFVVIQHLSPTHESLLPGILAGHTAMPVVQARDGMRLEADRVYVIPPAHRLGLREGTLFLVEPNLRQAVQMPIDFFFRCLAEDREERAVCVLFSGTGSDGTLGARAVRGAGGVVLAQDPRTAQFADLPGSAVAAGVVDHVLPVERMPEVIVDYLQLTYVKGQEPAFASGSPEETGSLQEVLELVLGETGCDFRCYKPATTTRRIRRRMGLLHVPDLAGYLALLRGDPDEVRRLLKDLMINVTAFFRDPEAFADVRDKAIAPLVRARPDGEPLRVWVPACATGEEAYSLAMLLLEQRAAAAGRCPLQVFATDINEEALEVARAGFYPENVAEDVGPERLERFFVRKEQGYRVKDALREVLTFAAQNVITDPPFSRMDLISCRNLLIYLDAEAQAKLMALFNFALKPGGHLFLGRSETVVGLGEVFETVSRRARLWRRLSPPRPISLDFPILPGKRKTVPPAPAPSLPQASNFADVVRLEILKHFGASAVLADRKGTILEFHGQTEKYLSLPATGPAFNVFELAREQLALKLRLAGHKAIQDGRTVVVEDARLARADGSSVVRVTAIPVVQRAQPEPLLLVFFEELPGLPAGGAEVIASPEDETIARRLEDELRMTQHDLQSTIEELQSSNEELRAANEEVTSTNEELQSANEELMTSAEEVQSTNEELTTVVNQLQEKIELLDRANSDMTNLLSSSQLAALFLDRELRIRFCTPAMARVMKVSSSDIGRPLAELPANLAGRDLAADLREVARTGATLEGEVQHPDGSWYLTRVLPYYTPAGRADGLVLTFSDITLVHESEQRFRAVVESSPNALVLAAADGRITLVNRQAEAMLGYARDELMGQTVEVLVPERFRRRHEGYRADFAARPQQRPMGAGRDLVAVRKDGSEFPVEIGLTPLSMPEGRVTLATITDITGRKRRDGCA